MQLEKLKMAQIWTISTGSELPTWLLFPNLLSCPCWNGFLGLCPRETCKLPWSEVLCFVDMSPAGPSVVLLSPLSAVRWPLLPGSVLWFCSQQEVGCLQMHGGRSRVLVHRSCLLISKVSPSGFSCLCPKHGVTCSKEDFFHSFCFGERHSKRGTGMSTIRCLWLSHSPFIPRIQCGQKKALLPLPSVRSWSLT